MPPTTMQDIVNRRNKNPQISTIEVICKGLNISLSEFFADELPEFPPAALAELNHFKQYLRYKYNLPNNTSN
jgi:transcriptional regulator with XRE-family HTH domain